MMRFRELCAVLVAVFVCWHTSAPLIEHWRFEQREDARLHAHFSRVLAELGQRDVSRLDDAQRVSRARLLSLLRAYDRRGRFPRNEGQRTDPTPIFVDRHGTRCAMAYLIEHADGAALVARIAASANLARIPELAGDGELGRWLAGAGLDLAEAARIQPTYDPPPADRKNPGPSREDHFPDDGLMASATILAVSFGIPAVALNFMPPRTWPENRQAVVFALMVGMESFGMGLVDGLHDGHLRGSGYAQLTIGACALTLGVLDLRDLQPGGHTAGAGTPPRARAAVAMRSGQEGEPQVGFQVRF